MVGSLRNSSLSQAASSMSSFNRRTFLLSAVALSGCGFSPTYGPNGSATKLRNQVSLAAPTDRNGYELAAQLAAIFGQPNAPKFSLSYDIETDEKAVGITPDQEITRYHVTGRVKYVLLDQATGQTAASGSVQSFTAYSATGTTVSTQSAKLDAYSRLMAILASQLSAQLQAKIAVAS